MKTKGQNELKTAATPGADAGRTRHGAGLVDTGGKSPRGKAGKNPFCFKIKD